MKNATRILVSGLLTVALVLAPAFGTFTIPTTIHAQAATLSLNKTSLSLGVGEKFTLKVKDTSKKVVWSSKNKAIATVTAKGEVKGVKVGSTTIYAKVGAKKMKCKVSVKKKSVKATAISVSTSLEPIDRVTNGDGETIDLYGVDINDFSDSWVKDNFKVTTTPANCSYTIKYADRTKGDSKFSTKVPANSGYYMVSFESGKQSYDIFLDITEDIEINVSSNLEVREVMQDGDGNDMDLYEVSISDFSNDWVKNNFTVTTDPQGRSYEIAYLDVTSEGEYSLEVPTVSGMYAVRFSVKQGDEIADSTYVWIDVVE